MEDNSETNLIINYLPQTLTDEEFRSMFQSIGPLKSCKIIRDKATSYSYGFGFVDYTNKDDADRAIKTLNGLQLQNKTIKVALARHGQNIKGANLYVRNLPNDMTQQVLSDMFAQFGSIVQCRILTDQFGNSKRVGFVLYNNREEAQAAISTLDGFVPPSGTEAINVKFAEDNRGKARPPGGMMGGGGGAGAGAGGGGGGGAPHRGGFQGGNYGPTGGYQGGYGNQGNYGSPYGGGGGNFGGPSGYGGGGPSFRGGMRGRGSVAGGPVRNQGRFAGNRFNPMSSVSGTGAGAANNFGAGDGSEGSGFVLFVYNIGLDADERSLWQLFSPFGQIQKVNVIRDYQKNQCKGYGFVTMTNYHEAQNAINNLNGYRYLTKPLQVSFKSDKQGIPSL